MTYAISSAEPLQLFRYRDFGFRVENELATEANRLGSVLRRFEASCTEYRVPVSHLADQLHGYANWAEDVDRFVGVVGLNFLVADSSTALARLIEDVVLKIHETVGGALLVISIRPGSTYLDQVNINLPNVLPKVSVIRKVFEISAPHTKYTNLIKKIGRPGPIVVVLTAVVISLKWYNDFVMYQRGDYTGTQLASALTADVVLTLVPTGAAIVGAIAGAKIGGVVGTMIAPGPGTAIGAVLGGIVGSIALGWGADAALDHIDARDRMIPWLDEKVFQPLARGIANTSQALEDLVDHVAVRWLHGDIKTESTGHLPPVIPISPPDQIEAPVSTSGDPRIIRLPVASDSITSINWYGNTNFAHEHRDEYYSRTQGLHSGIDFLAPQGTDVVSPINLKGEVISINGKPYCFGANSPGSVLVDYGSYLVLYGHTVPGDDLAIGTLIDPGTSIGCVGNQQPPHLHLEVIPKLDEWDSLPPEKPRGRPGNDRVNPVEFLTPELRELLEGFEWDSFVKTDDGSWMTPDDQPRIKPGGPYLL